MAERKRFHIPTSEEMDDGKKDGSNNFRPTQIFKSYKEQQSTSDNIIHKKARVEPATLQGKALQKQEETTISNSENSEVSYVVTSTSSTGSTNLLTDNKTILSDSEKKILSAPGTSKSILGQTKQRNQTENHSVDVSKLAIPGKTNSLLVNQRQRGNPILKYVRNIPWEFGDIVPDYVMGQTTCALFLSLRYHQLNPNYIHERLKQLGRSYDLRILLVQIDIKEPHHLLKELAKICILADCTLILAFSTEEAGRYLETYKVYENKPPDAIMEKTDQNFMAKMTECLTNIKSVNKTDVSTLISTFGSLKGIVEASQEDLSFCPGFGPQKAKRVHDLFKEPFLRSKKDKK